MAKVMDAHTLSRIIAQNAAAVNWDLFSAGDWEQLAHKAQEEGVAPLIYWQFSQAGKISALPQSARDTLRAAYSQSWRHNQSIFNELEILAREFDHAGIPIVVLKGACFALTIYPDIGTRPMSDLDILTPSSKYDQALQIVKSLGYAKTTPDDVLVSHAVSLEKTGQPSVAVEIHKSLVDDEPFIYAVPMDWFWDQTEALNNPRYPNLLMLSPGAQILYASAHAMLKHGGSAATLRWFVDIDRIVRFYANRLDWETLLSQADIFEWSSALEAALAQTLEYFDTPIPARVRVELSGNTDRHKMLVASLKKKPLTHTQQELQKMRTLNTYGKIRLMLALIAPSPDYMLWRYKLKTYWALPIYYPFRWWGILKDGLHTVVVLIQKQLFSH